MTRYINPRGETKEQWLKSNAVRLYCIPKLEDIPVEKRLVCLVDNGAFTAAAVAEDDVGYRAFTRADDYRPKTWWLAPADLLLNVT